MRRKLVLIALIGLSIWAKACDLWLDMQADQVKPAVLKARQL